MGIINNITHEQLQLAFTIWMIVLIAIFVGMWIRSELEVKQIKVYNSITYSRYIQYKELYYQYKEWWESSI